MSLNIEGDFQICISVPLKVRFYFVWFKIGSLKTGFSYIIGKICVWVLFIKLGERVSFININGDIFKIFGLRNHLDIS